MIFDPKNLLHVRELTLDNINDTRINKSELHGFGLFATQSIKQDAILCLLDGRLSTSKPMIIYAKHYYRR
jgi:hypothetical protein